MHNVAFGLGIGNAVSIFGLALALGALAVPFTVDVPTDYLLLMVGAPFLLIPVLLTGAFTPSVGLLFVGIYAVIFSYLVYRERQLDRTFLQSEEVKEVITAADGQGETSSLPAFLPSVTSTVTNQPGFWLATTILAVGGITVGADVSATGVHGVLTTWDLSGTFVGVTLVTLLYTIDDILLMVEPLRLGYPDVAVGGIVGSLLFFVTANVGIIAIAGTVHFSPATLVFHVPVLLLFTALSGYFLWRGRLTRWHGLLLLGLYVLYLTLSVLLFSSVPVQG